MRPAVVLAVLAAVAWPAGSASAQSGAGMTYESLERLPDFGGAWVPEAFPFEGEAPSGRVSLPREVRPEAAARFQEERDRLVAGEAVERGYCAPAAFGGRLPMNAGGALEILFTPGRVTIAVESGLVRRIYLRKTPLPTGLDVSRGGSSIGHWEGRTLVVETTGLSPTAIFPPGLPLGRGAKATERISLRDPDTLAIETTTTAPDIMVAPLTSVNLYRRARDRFFTEFDTCIAGDRSFDAESKHERFDATPPPDLPPPPTD